MLRVHEGPVTGLSLHATGDYVLTTSTDHCWAFSGTTFYTCLSVNKKYFPSLLWVRIQIGSVFMICLHPDPCSGSGSTQVNTSVRILF